MLGALSAGASPRRSLLAAAMRGTASRALGDDLDGAVSHRRESASMFPVKDGEFNRSSQHPL